MELMTIKSVPMGEVKLNEIEELERKLLIAEEALEGTKALIAQLKRDARNVAILQDKNNIYRKIEELEHKKRCQQQEILAISDEIIAKRGELITLIEYTLQQSQS